MATLTLTLTPAEAALIYRAVAIYMESPADPAQVAAVLVLLCRERVAAHERG